MKTQHTPGPWNVGDDSPNEYEGPTIENIDTVIAVIPIDDVNDSTPEERANAQLIATAPELLSMLQRLAEKVRRATYIHSTGGHVAKDTWDELYLIQGECFCAIAKATGEPR